MKADTENHRPSCQCPGAGGGAELSHSLPGARLSGSWGLGFSSYKAETLIPPPSLRSEDLHLTNLSVTSNSVVRAKKID